MGKALKLVNKLKRREKAMKADRNGFDRYDKQGQAEEKLAKSKGYKLIRGQQRRMDSKLGTNMIADEAKLSKRLKITTLERFDFDPGAGTDFGLRATMPAAVLTDIGIRANDIIKVLQGNQKGKYLKVISVVSSTQIRLEDVSTFGSSQSNVQTRAQISDVKKSYK